MSLHDLRTLLRRPLAAGLLGAGLALAGVALVDAATSQTFTLPNGKTYTTKAGEMLLPMSTLELWRKESGRRDVQLQARCSGYEGDVGLCTTVVVPLGEGGGSGSRTTAEPNPPGVDPAAKCLPPRRWFSDGKGQWTCRAAVLVPVE